MKKLLSFAIAMFLMSNSSSSYLFGEENSFFPPINVNVPEIKIPDTITVKPDFSDLGKELGGAGRDIVREGIGGIFEGFREATENKQMYHDTGRALKNMSRDFAKEFNDPELRDNLRAGSMAGTSLMGAATEGFVDGLDINLFPHIKRMSFSAMSSVFNLKNGLQFAIPTLTFITLTTSLTIGFKLLEQRLLNPKPAILLVGSKYGRIDRFKRWKTGYKTPPMIFDASIKERLEEIEEKTKNIRDHIRNGEKITYDNLLLYGKPGTGKTLFAQILADKTDMDFLPVTAASLLQCGVEGIKYFDELITMANNSKYGVIIFVDEADALFVDRDKLSPDSDHYKVLNHILAATGSGSNKFMLIAATNHAYVMDPAMGRRFQDRVLLPLPDQNTRKELLTIYMNQQLFDAKSKKPTFISAARTILTTKKINEIAQQTAGLSHAEIKDMVTIMAKKAHATKNGIITTRNVDSAVAEAIEKMHALERDRIELEKKNAMQLKPSLQPTIVNEQEIIIPAAA